MVYFFSKKEKSNSLALIYCVNAFVFCFVLVWFFSFQASRNSQVEKKAGESSIKRFLLVLLFFFSLCDLVVSFK